jgi:2,2-dialkylglycine decarboxylase (pyruvate)
MKPSRAGSAAPSHLRAVFESHSPVADAHLVRYAGPFIPGLVVRAQGAYIYDNQGREILDFTSGQMCAILGHNHPDVVAAIMEACRNVIHLHSSQLSPPVLELAQIIASQLPPKLQKMIFLSTGSESNEAALRMAKLYSGGFEVYAFSGSWHGLTGGASASTYAFGRQGYGPMVPGVQAIPSPNCYRCPIRHCRDRCDMTCLEAGFELADRQSVGAPAAFIFEPIISAGGIIDLPPGYLKRLRELCDARGLLIIADEAQTAFGRMGILFGYQQEPGFVPDFLTMSKSLGGGLPLSATVTSAEIEETCYSRGYIHATSHVSDPLPAAVGVALLKVITRDRLVENARVMGEYLKGQLRELQRRHECIGDVRGRGLLLGVEIVADRDKRTPAPALGSAISQRCYELNLSMNIVRLPLAGSVFRIAPPFTITRAQIDTAIGILDRAIDECVAKQGAGMLR